MKKEFIDREKKSGSIKEGKDLRKVLLGSS